MAGDPLRVTVGVKRLWLLKAVVPVALRLYGLRLISARMVERIINGAVRHMKVTANGRTVGPFRGRFTVSEERV